MKESPQAVTFADFAAFVIAACFVVAVFVAPYIMAWHYLDAHLPPYHPTTTSTPRKAGATLPPAHSLRVSIWGGDPSQPAQLRSTMGQGRGASEHGVRHVPGSETSLAESRAGVALQTLANGAASLCGIDPALFWSLILRESSGRHWDAEGRVLRSRSNALGLGQIKASTARGVSPLLDPLKPWDNAVASACHLRSLIDANKGNVRKSLHDYHAGAYRKRTTAATLAYASDILSTGGAQ